MTETTLRDHARAGVRTEVMRRAWELFAVQGYDATTVDQVAEAAGMSRRSFFRYFEGKDELVAAQLQESGEDLAADLSARPVGEPAWSALRAVLQGSARRSEENADASRALQRMLEDEPSLRGATESRRHHWSDVLVPAVAERLGVRADDPAAAAVTLSALACYEVARHAWAAPGCSTPLGTLLDRAMEAVAPLGA
ncbi:TetR family transcriptional regulator [Marmoricola endophyticus]|uniref:TetR family transcriptional regulator n=1 Tax=Marmoricola endophyticus TaxID=2040280 RepID=A0A917F1X5_9ACTN|nr:TetR/AcrR family transcriptional regulator [Marmoricola endophyticus]GGF41889.1 TetR family transcriptional regulator [Marmoricola endophyticus]